MHQDLTVGQCKKTLVQILEQRMSNGPTNLLIIGEKIVEMKKKQKISENPSTEVPVTATGADLVNRK